MCECGKVKKVLGNKTGITSYPWTVWGWRNFHSWKSAHSEILYLIFFGKYWQNQTIVLHRLPTKPCAAHGVKSHSPSHCSSQTNTRHNFQGRWKPSQTFCCLNECLSKPNQMKKNKDYFWLWKSDLAHFDGAYKLPKKATNFIYIYSTLTR